MHGGVLLTMPVLIHSHVLEIPWSVQGPVLYFGVYCVHWCWQCRVVLKSPIKSKATYAMCHGKDIVIPSY